MKVISIIGIVIGMIGLIVGLYNLSEYVPYAVDTSREDWIYYDDKVMFIGYIALGTGTLGFLLGLMGAIKKEKIGWIAVAISLGALYFGLSQATHMFS